MSKTSLALSNLRGFVILIVLSFHSVLAYLGSLPETAAAFDAPPFRWQAFPITDSRRWFGFDLFCAVQDVYLMTFMFFLSGLFVWTSLRRKGTRVFLSDRFVRLGLPFVLVVLFLMPVAHYPVYLATAANPSVAEYWRQWIALPLWPSGPPWFLWQLLVLNVAAAVIFWFAPQFGNHLARLSSAAASHPVRYFAGLVALSAVAYVPMALAFTPWEWQHFGPFGFQICRPLHYTVYFFAGVGLGAYGLDRGLLAADGMLARRWAWWLGAGFVGFLLWIVPTALIMEDGDQAPLGFQVLANIGYVLGCGSGCFAMAAFFLRFAAQRSRTFDSLSENAYGMYLLHYVFVVWMQYSLLSAPLPAVIKASIVFGITLALSWATVAGLRRIPLGGRLLGEERRVLAKAP